MRGTRDGYAVLAVVLHRSDTYLLNTGMIPH
jgi:hypothetical protein